MTRFRPHSRTGRSSAPLDSRSAVAVSIVGGGWRRTAVVGHQARPAISSVHRTDAENHRAAAAGDAPLVRWRAVGRIDARTPLTGIYPALIPEIHLRPRFPDAPGSACHRHKVTRVECRERERPALQPKSDPVSAGVQECGIAWLRWALFRLRPSFNVPLPAATSASMRLSADPPTTGQPIRISARHWRYPIDASDVFPRGAALRQLAPARGFQ